MKSEALQVKEFQRKQVEERQKNQNFKHFRDLTDEQIEIERVLSLKKQDED